MQIGTLIKVGDRLATTTSNVYVKLVRTQADLEMCAAGLDYGTARSFVDVVFADTKQASTLDLSKAKWGTA